MAAGRGRLGRRAPVRRPLGDRARQDDPGRSLPPGRGARGWALHALQRCHVERPVRAASGVHRRSERGPPAAAGSCGGRSARRDARVGVGARAPVHAGGRACTLVAREPSRDAWPPGSACATCRSGAAFEFEFSMGLRRDDGSFEPAHTGPGYSEHRPRRQPRLHVRPDDDDGGAGLGGAAVPPRVRGRTVRAVHRASRPGRRCRCRDDRSADGAGGGPAARMGHVVRPATCAGSSSSSRSAVSADAKAVR